MAFAGRNIAVFPLDAGPLFEGFHQQAARLVLPAFAFLTFYSLCIIMFGAFYIIGHTAPRGTAATATVLCWSGQGARNTVSA